MKKIGSATICLLLSILSAAPSLSAQESAESAAKSNILALEYAWNQAEEHGDIKALGAIFDNALVLIDWDGKVLTKAEYLAQVKTDAAVVEQVTTEKLEVRVFDRSAIVIGIYSIRGVNKGKPYVSRRRFLDTWALIDGRWLCIGSESTPIH